MNIYAPEDADFDYRFDREYEEAKALEKFKEMKIKNRKVISSYYIHDTRIFELYFL